MKCVIVWYDFDEDDLGIECENNEATCPIIFDSKKLAEDYAKIEFKAPYYQYQIVCFEEEVNEEK